MSIIQSIMINRLINSCWNDFQKVKNNPFVVKGSIPILWFGDLEAYFKSQIRVITVARNPSNKEFVDNHNNTSIALRFPDAAKIVSKTQLTISDKDSYKQAMNNYFKIKPYMKWFCYNEAVLNGIDASYFGNDNVAIHIDIHSPVATSPTWTGLDSQQQNLLNTNYTNLFAQLISYLNPQYIISAEDKSVLEVLFNLSNSPKSIGSFYTSNTKPKRFIHAYKYPNGRVLICGNVFQGTPFAGMTKKVITTNVKSFDI